MTLGQNIQTARKAKGMSQETLAEKIGVSRQALGKWEKDTALPGRTPPCWTPCGGCCRRRAGAATPILI